MAEEIDWPKVSLITPTYNKKKFVDLMLNNFNNFDYPKDKLEWIILDDSNESIAKYLPKDPRIKYYYYDRDMITKMYIGLLDHYKKKRLEYKQLNNKDKKGHLKYKLRFKKQFKHLPIGMKRNVCVQYSTSDIILHFDDDDYYPPSSIKERVLPIINRETYCVGCIEIGCFHISKYISIVFKSPENLSPSKKISVATIGYTKDFWKQKKFENQDVNNEGEYFLKKREFKVLDWKNIIVALFHSKNDINNRAFEIEPNGWHFDKLDDDTFLLITSIEESQIKSDQ